MNELIEWLQTATDKEKEQLKEFICSLLKETE
jgi:hypothetical protein